ncbi:glycosyltransferase [Paenibacillus sp. P32E]|uniref:glycosyltransferase n=1 Tax=Paenibacillus sp. P32E TaxID=1349434 RepID=UPI0021170943|nr:glycosyltransferase [Paenibacillus sp. P32E]
MCGIGSTGRIATDIHGILLDHGHESYIAYGRGEPRNCNNSVRIGTNLDNYMHLVRTRLKDDHGFGSEVATINFIEKLRDINPDVIHLHNIHGYYLNIKILFDYLYETNKPLVWTLHDCWPFTGHCAYFDYVGCERWKSGCFQCPQKQKYPSSFFKDNSKSNYAMKKALFASYNNITFVTPSNWLAKLLKQSFLSEFPQKVIYNGVDTSIFKPAKTSNFRKTNNLKNKFIILGVANIWDERKGLKYFLELSSFLDRDEIIVLIGLSESQRKNLPLNIIGISRTNNIVELSEIYSEADVFVNPTLEDNFPMTNIEALACGTPIVTFNTGGSIEAVDNHTGFVVRDNNTKSMLEMIRKVKIKTKQFYEDNCVNRVSYYFSKEKSYNNYLELYRGFEG